MLNAPWSDLSRDWRYARRQLARRPLSSLCSALSTGLGVASLVTVVLIYQQLIGRLPFPAPQEIVELTAPVIVSSQNVQVPAEFATLPVFSSLGVYSPGSAAVGLAGAGGHVPVAAVDAGFFETLKVPPLRGRVFGRDNPQTAALAVIGENLWNAERRASGSNSDTLLLNGRRFSVVGVMPKSFSFPGSSEVWIPLRAAREVTGRVFQSTVIARLRRGISLNSANAAVLSALGGWASGSAASGEVRTR